MPEPLDSTALDQLFRQARSQNAWLDRPVPTEHLTAIYDLMRWGPTSANCFPVRIVFVTSQAAKDRLVPLVFDNNQQRVATAPVTAILGHDLHFYDWLPRLFPHTDARSWFAGKPEFAELTALRNGTLQVGYFMLAARSLGLDCGPMSGFDNAAVDAEFFPGGQVRSNVLCSIGYGDASALFGRLPRPDFAEVCSVQ